MSTIHFIKNKTCKVSIDKGELISFQKENIEVNILSDTNPADSRFKRITLNDL